MKPNKYNKCPDRCGTCGSALIPDKTATIVGKKQWDGHTYKYNCKCINENIRICIG